MLPLFVTRAMMDKLYLDPEYKHYEPGKTSLKFTSVSYEAHPALALLMFILWSPFGIVGVLILAAIFSNFQPQENFRELEAIVTDCKTVNVGRSGHGIELSYTYFIYNSSEAKQKFERTETIGTLSLTCKDIPSGAVITIKYNRFDPADSSVTDSRIIPSLWYQLFTQLIFFCVSIYSILTGILLFLALIFSPGTRKKARQKYERLRHEGRVLDGKIIRWIPSKMIIPMITTGEKIHYQFTSPDGKVLEGKQDVDRRKPFYGGKIPAPDTTVSVLYAGEDCHIML